VGEINVVGTDQEELLGLWEWARREYDAANALLLMGDRGQGRSVALHLFRGWHALASMFAFKSGEPEPELESFTLERESVLLAPISSRRFSDWASSFESIRATALRIPWRSGTIEPDDRHLRRQARFLGRCLKAQYPRVARKPFTSRSWRIGWRSVFTVIAVLVLVFAAFDLGKRLSKSIRRPADAEDTAPSIPQDVHLSLEQLSDPKPRGHEWDGPGTVKFMDRAFVSLGGICHAETLAISLDGNDGYRIRLKKGDDAVHIENVGPSFTHGLEIYTVAIPEEAISDGFDTVVIEVRAGDSAYALGHLLLGPNDDNGPAAVE